jgi:hypothetical protein
MPPLWRFLADVVLGLHYAFMAYLVLGGFIAWRWPRTTPFHVAAAIWAVLIVTTKIPCPLTSLQNNLRERAGLPPLGNSFVNLYLRGHFYPSDAQMPAQAVLGLVILVSWTGLAWLLVQQRHQKRIAH